MPDNDVRVRLAAFKFLEEKESILGEVLPRAILVAGFDFDGTRVPLIGPQGIFRPSVLREMPLSITTVPVVEGRPRPYADEVGSDGLIGYRYRGTDPAHRDNAGLRQAMLRRVPLVYFYGLVPGRYLAVWPVYVVRDDQGSLCFSVEVGRRPGRFSYLPDEGESEDATRASRRYITVETQRRLHQSGFRQRVLLAYRECCAICRLRHSELLDAAHILPDADPRGEPWVCNGLALCKLHHAAFDSDLLGIRPDLVVEIRRDILEESDGPILKHGLKECHNQRLMVVPHSHQLRPRTDLLEGRYEMFLRRAS